MSDKPRTNFDACRYRADFPILQKLLPGDRSLVFLDNAASTQHPQVVIDAIVDCYSRYYANVHRGVHWLSETSTDRFEQARTTVARFLNSASEAEVIFTAGCTAAINTIARSWGESNLSQGDLILMTEMEHHANLVPWFQVAEKTGARTRLVKITDHGLLDRADLMDALNQRPKLFAFTAVSNVLGTINPVKELAGLAHNVGAVVVVDAAQAAPHLPIDVQDWDADFVAISGHKVLGPNGIGVLWGKRALLDAMPPFLGGGGMIHRVHADHFTAAELPAKFEAGTPPIVEAIALATAMDYVQQVGLNAIAEHEHRLTELTHREFEKIGGVRLFGPSPDQKGGIVSFVVEGAHSHDVAQVLDQHGVAVRAGHHCAMPLHKRLGVNSTSRASFYLYNTEEDVHRLVEAVTAVKNKFSRKGSPRQRTVARPEA